VACSLLGGAVADRMDRRTLLLLCQVALVAVAAALATGAFLGSPPVWLLYVLAGLAAGAAAVERVARSALVPNVVAPDQLRSALSFSFGLYQLTAVVGPALGGVLIAALGVGTAYTVDAASCAGMVVAAAAMSAQPPPPGRGREPILASIAEGLRYSRRDGAILGSFVIDIIAMTFGMPRALFPALSLTVYHAGASGTGFLFAAVSAGATVAALTTGWLPRARRLGRIVVVSVAVWGAAIAAAGLATTLWIALVLFVLAGAADSVSAVCRSTILQTRAPEAMRGRLSSVFSLVVAGGPRLGDVEAGGIASLTSVRFSVASGGLACLAGVAMVAIALPAFVGYDAERAQPIGALAESEA
jgi:MFS family permease